MKEVYYYCSYKRSPVGFEMGRLCHEPGRTENYELSKEKIDPFIRGCFENGAVRAACGVLPNKEPPKYFLLIRRLLAHGQKKGEPDDYNINLALVTEDRSMFDAWSQDRVSEAEVADAIKDSMEIDDYSDFGFTVRPQKLTSLLEQSLGSLFKGAKPDLDKDEFCLETRYEDADLDELAHALGLSKADGKFYPSAQKWATYRKKKEIPIAHLWEQVKANWKIILTALILVVAIAAIFFRLLKK